MSNVSLFMDFLNREHYQIYYIPVAKALRSLEAGILFQEFVQRYQYHSTREELIEIQGKGVGWFYHTRESIEERTMIGRRGMDHAVETLVKYNLIEVTNFGLPRRRYFRLNLDGIEAFLKNLSSLHTSYKQPCPHRTSRPEHSEQTRPLYIEEPKEDPKEERVEKPESAQTQHNIHYRSPHAPPSLPKLIERNTHIFTTNQEHEALLKRFGKEKTIWCYQRLSEWKQDTSKSKWKKSDYRSILRWVVDAVDEKQLKNKKQDTQGHEGENRAWFREALKKVIKPNSDENWLQEGEYIQFKNDERQNSSAKIFFRDDKFRDLVKHELAKRQYVIKK